jgi:MOSC domain-containing protein YiiM
VESVADLADDDWAGCRLTVGDDVVLQVLYAMPRCVMLDLPSADLTPAHGLLRTVTDANGGDLGVVADVLAPGRVSVGDPVSVSRWPPPRSS